MGPPPALTLTQTQLLPSMATNPFMILLLLMKSKMSTIIIFWPIRRKKVALLQVEKPIPSGLGAIVRRRIWALTSLQCLPLDVEHYLHLMPPSLPSTNKVRVDPKRTMSTYNTFSSSITIVEGPIRDRRKIPKLI